MLQPQILSDLNFHVEKDTELHIFGTEEKEKELKTLAINTSVVQANCLVQNETL